MATLADDLIRAAQPRERPYKLPREEGLFVVVNPNGSKWWRLAYSFDGRERQISLGVYPRVSIKVARARRDQAHCLIAEGRDPSQERKEVKEQRRLEAAATFELVAREWLAKKKPTMAPITYAKARWMLETFAIPRLGKLPLAKIQPRDVLETLRPLERKGLLETMHRVKGRISEIFRYAIPEGRALSDPCRDLRGSLLSKRAVRHHAALTDPIEVGRLMRAIDSYRGAPETCAALQLAPLLFVRPGELRAAQWSQFDLDGPNPSWRYVPSKTKKPHIVPLASQAVAILRDLRPLTGYRDSGRQDLLAWVFPNVRTRSRPMSENALTAALRGLGYTGDQMTWHGFRAMARTLLAELGWRPDAIERQLAHKASGPLGEAYDRAQYLDERRRMMQAWADYLDQLRQGNVLQGEFARAA